MPLIVVLFMIIPNSVAYFSGWDFRFTTVPHLLPGFIELEEVGNCQGGGNTIQKTCPERVLVLTLGRGEVRGAEAGTKARTSAPGYLIGCYDSLWVHGVDSFIG